MKKIIFIFIVSLFFRFLYLDIIPVSLAHDEIDNIIQSHSVIHTGTDIAGTWNPLRFLPNSTMMGELAPLINVPMLSIFPESLLTARATSALLSSIYPLLLMIFLIKLGVARSVATASAFFLAISPWHIIFSRTALEQPTSLFFYTLSWIFLINLFQSKKVTSTSFILHTLSFILSYTIGFFTYHGFKFSLPLLTGVLALYLAKYQSAKFSVLKLLLPIVYLGLLFVHVLLNQSAYAGRAVEMIFSQSSSFAKEVDLERRISLAPPVLKPIFSNKYISLAQTIGDKYLYAISPDLLFQHGENNGAFALWTIGYLYLFTLPLLLLGFVSLLSRHRPEHWIVLILLLLSPIASVIHTNDSYAFRSAIYFVLLNVVLAYGWVYFYQLVTTKLARYQRWILALVAIFAITSIAHFAYLYYFVSPINNSNSYFFSERILAQYVNHSSSQKILIIDPQPRYVYSGIILSEPLITSANMASFNHQYGPVEDDTYNYRNVTVMRDCPTGNHLDYDTVIIAKQSLSNAATCGSIKERIAEYPELVSSLVSAKDSGEERVIIGDYLCERIVLRSYVSPTTLNDLRLDRLSPSQFCSIWIVKQ